MLPSLTVRRRMLRAALSGVVYAAGCSGITDVNAPDVVQPSALDNRAGADTRRAGAISAFANAFVVRVMVTSWITDEQVSTTATGDPTDQRVVRDPDAIYPYIALQRA